MVGITTGRILAEILDNLTAVWSNNIVTNLMEHFTENLADNFSAEISNCLIDLFNERPDLNFFYLFFTSNFNPFKN